MAEDDFKATHCGKGREGFFTCAERNGPAGDVRFVGEEAMISTRTPLISSSRRKFKKDFLKRLEPGHEN